MTSACNLDLSTMSKNYGSWSLAELKNELRKRNAKLTGKKAVLVQRLEDYDQLFGPLINNPEAVYKIVVPNPELFQDVTSDSKMPVLTEADLEAFSELAERADLITSKNMYFEKFLISCRTSYQNGDYYVTGVCASEMRRNISYNITVKAKDNIILEAQCECAAGAGPYGQCKHILVVIYGITDFNERKMIKLKETCTSSLQTFHHPRTNYTGNPIQSENLTLKFKDTAMKDIKNFDPRKTVGSTEKYQESFKSLIANSLYEHPRMPISQLLLPADKRSVYRDHDYMKKTAEEEYFNSLLLNTVELNDLEEITKTNRKEWLKQRIFRLQSSDFGKICKQQTNKSKLAKMLMKVTHILSPAIKHGRKYEPEAIKVFENVTGLIAVKTGIIVHPEHQFLGSTPDALVGNDATLEIKCPYTAHHKNISAENVPYLYLCERTGKLKLDEKHNYNYQIQGQMFCSKRNKAYLFIYTITDHLLIKIERDQELINNMFKDLKSFYENYYKEALLTRFFYGERNYI